RGGGNSLPQLQQVGEIPLQFFGAATDASGADDNTHAVGYFDRRQRFAQFGALVALDAARDAAGARIVRHQHQVTAGKADKRSECRALVAALLFIYLHDDFSAFLYYVLDLDAAANITGLAVEVYARNLDRKSTRLNSSHVKI